MILPGFYGFNHTEIFDRHIPKHTQNNFDVLKPHLHDVLHIMKKEIIGTYTF